MDETRHTREFSVETLHKLPSRKKLSIASAEDRDNTVVMVSKSVQEIIKKELGEMIKIHIDETSDLQQLESVSEEIEIISENIAKVIVGHITSFEEVETTTVSLHELMTMIKIFFAKMLAKFSVSEIMKQLKNKFFDHTPADMQSAQSHMDCVDSLLQIDQDGGQQGKASQVNWLQDISSGEDLEFSRCLSDILVSFVDELACKNVTDPSATSPSPIRVFVTVPRTTIHTDIEIRLREFIGQMRLWLNTQADNHIERLIACIEEDTWARVSSSVAANWENYTRTKYKKAEVKTIVKKLYSRLLKQTNIDIALEDHYAISERLVDKIWPHFKCEDFNITTETLKHLDKTICKELCKSFGCAETVLAVLLLDYPAAYKYIASCFKAQLMSPPKKSSTICRVFASVGRVITKPFRKTPHTKHLCC